MIRVKFKWTDSYFCPDKSGTDLGHTKLKANAIEFKTWVDARFALAHFVVNLDRDYEPEEV